MQATYKIEIGVYNGCGGTIAAKAFVSTIEMAKNDLRRQHSKHFIVFSGPGVLAAAGVSPFNCLAGIIQRGWGFNLARGDISSSHFRKNGKEIIAEFRAS